jgi:hypothetical protein
MVARSFRVGIDLGSRGLIVRLPQLVIVDRGTPYWILRVAVPDVEHRGDGVVDSLESDLLNRVDDDRIVADPR